jgi:AraC-like DNA-binding protein
MRPDFDHPNNLGFQTTVALSPDHKGLILQGAEERAVQGESGRIILQDLIHPAFQIHVQVYHLLQPMVMPAKQEKAFLVAFLSLKNSIQYFIKGLGQFRLKQGQFALLHTNTPDGRIQFHKKGFYQSIEVVWSEALVKEAIPHFSFLKTLFSRERKQTSFYLQGPGQYAGSHALNIVQAILNSPHEAGLSKLYFRHKVQEYLLAILKEADRSSGSKISLSRNDYDSVALIAKKLTSHLDQHFPIDVLAREVRMNEMKLKMVFKEVYGSGIFEYQLDARMKEAHRLLEETDLNTKTIASMVGYQLGTSFITKFREYFGYPPSIVTRKK